MTLKDEIKRGIQQRVARAYECGKRLSRRINQSFLERNAFVARKNRFAETDQPVTVPVAATDVGVIAPSVMVITGVVVAVATDPETPAAVATDADVTVPPEDPAAGMLMIGFAAVPVMVTPPVPAATDATLVASAAVARDVSVATAVDNAVFSTRSRPSEALIDRSCAAVAAAVTPAAV